MWCLARYVWNSKIKTRTTYNHSFNGRCFNFRESAISEHYSTKMPLKACYLQDEEKAKDLWETHTKHNTAPTNSEYIVWGTLTKFGKTFLHCLWQCQKRLSV